MSNVVWCKNRGFPSNQMKRGKFRFGHFWTWQPGTMTSNFRQFRSDILLSLLLKKTCFSLYSPWHFPSCSDSTQASSHVDWQSKSAPVQNISKSESLVQVCSGPKVNVQPSVTAIHAIGHRISHGPYAPLGPLPGHSSAQLHNERVRDLLAPMLPKEAPAWQERGNPGGFVKWASLVNRINTSTTSVFKDDFAPPPIFFETRMWGMDD